MSISKTLNAPKSSVAPGIISMCNFVKELEDSGEFAKAAETMGEWWSGVGKRPNVDKLPAEQKAAVLARAGSLSGWLGSLQQAPGSQEKAKDLISEAASLFSSLEDDKNWAETRSDLAVCYWREGAFDEARDVLDDVLARSIDLAPQLRGKILLRGVNVEISTKHFNKADSLIEQATPPIEKSKNSLLRGKLYFHKALILRSRAEDNDDPKLLLSAIDYYKHAGVYYKKAKHNLFLAHVENNTGNVYRLLRDFKNTQTHLDKAIYLYSKLKDQAHAALVYETKAQAYLAELKLKDAEGAARTSVAMVRKGGEQSLLAECLTTLGVVLSRQANFAEAVHAFVEAKEAALLVGDLESAGNAVLTQLEELQPDLSPAVFRSLYIEADELLKKSPRLSTLDRLQAITRKQMEAGKAETEESADSQKMAKLLSYADKLDTLFENKAEFSWENFSLPDAVKIYEGEIIMKALIESSGRVTKAAKMLGLSHQNLSLILHQRHRELKKYCVHRKPRSKSVVKTH
jgi:tetratricopeptide (TPR) repeat protein